MSDTKVVLSRQFDIAWKLAEHHLTGLTTEECLWRPAHKGPHVHQKEDGTWRADWPERNTYDVGPPSIAWLTWHVVFWWSMALDHSFGPAKLAHQDVPWPGSAEAVRSLIGEKKTRWVEALGALNAIDLDQNTRTRWPFRNRPFADVVAWLNLELMKNAVEIGYARFLYATRDRIE